ncbi:MAG TPA: NifU family protein [Sedimentisphaerales bacterium]|jgi:Fe-S cluster biogenesis protein NfuA|nr:NifU family protein [Sedimentisphaerales bacterium]HNU28706.1 NifU family protein [Sedimentisphaerales bacterium]
MADKVNLNETGDGKTFEEKVTEVIESVRPALQGHGGDVELIGVDEDKTVRLRLQGACRGCPGATMTMKMGIERILREKVPEVKQVVAVA